MREGAKPEAVSGGAEGLGIEDYDCVVCVVTEEI